MRPKGFEHRKRKVEEKQCSVCGEQFKLLADCQSGGGIGEEGGYQLSACKHCLCYYCFKELAQDAILMTPNPEDRSFHCTVCETPLEFDDLRVTMGAFSNIEDEFKAEDPDALFDEMSNADDFQAPLPKPDAAAQPPSSPLRVSFESRLSGDAMRGSSELRISNYLVNPQLRRSLRKDLVPEVYIPQSVQEFINGMDNIVTCPHCNNIFERIPQTQLEVANECAHLVVTNERGQPIDEDHLKHYIEHRFRCRVCNTAFCDLCNMKPYHTGYTCEEFKNRKETLHCRFCESDLEFGTKPYNEPVPGSTNLIYVCNEEECLAKAKDTCTNTLSCSHACYGVKDEKECCRCLHPDCSKGGTDADEFCSICYVESLAQAPCVELPCSHVFHKHCIQQRLSEGYPTSFISFKFASCPLCDARIDHPAFDLERIRSLETIVRKKAYERMVLEGMLHDPDLQQGGSFFGRPEDYAVAKLAFYECFKCKEPYYGGRRECEANNDEAGGGRNISREDLLCTGCSGLDAKCEKHGSEYIEFKCRFCCRVATYFCGGSCHYCDPCHDHAGDLTDFDGWKTRWNSKYLQPCPGPELCPLGIAHAKNGEEFALGCVMCRAKNVEHVEKKKALVKEELMKRAPPV